MTDNNQEIIKSGLLKLRSCLGEKKEITILDKILVQMFIKNLRIYEKPIPTLMSDIIGCSIDFETNTKELEQLTQVLPLLVKDLITSIDATLKEMEG